MGKGGDQLARGRIPELGGFVRARRQDPSTIRTKRRVVDRILMVKGGDQLARGRIPELGGFVRACRQDPSPSGLNAACVDLHPDGQRRRSACPRPHPRAWRCCPRSPSGSEHRPD